MNEDRRPSKALPIAIVLAAIIIGVSVYLVFRKPETAGVAVNPAAAAEAIPSPSSTEHILGNPNAPIVIIEYTDLECPYCKNFHTIMKMLMNDYGKKGQLAWVVRNFPVPQLHPRAIKEHEAAECAAEIGGNDAYFTYIDKIFARTPSNNGLDPELLLVVAGEVGIDKTVFASCLDSGKYSKKVQDEATVAFKSGAQGTPYSIVVSGSQKYAVPGAQSYKVMRSLIDSLVSRESGNKDVIPPYTTPLN